MRKRRIGTLVSSSYCIVHAILFTPSGTFLFLDGYVPPVVLSHRSKGIWFLLSSNDVTESTPKEQTHLINEDHATDHRHSKMDATSRFHMDMRRMLKSRRNSTSEDGNISTSLHEFSPMERRIRPTILTEDIDGAIRVTSMLRHMVNIDAATEESFQIVFQALVGRGRLRWKNRDSVVVCAADEVMLLMDEIWERQNGKVSTKTCDLALQVYAACCTPRGDRRYAQKAQKLLNSMEENGIIPSTQSYSYVINA